MPDLVLCEDPRVAVLEEMGGEGGAKAVETDPTKLGPLGWASYDRISDGRRSRDVAVIPMPANTRAGPTLRGDTYDT
jgi:hypothetical protein